VLACKKYFVLNQIIPGELIQYIRINRAKIVEKGRSIGTNFLTKPNIIFFFFSSKEFFSVFFTDFFKDPIFELVQHPNEKERDLSRVAKWYILKPISRLWVNFERALEWKMLVYYMYGHLVYCKALVYFWTTGTFSSRFGICTKKNLATLDLRFPLGRGHRSSSL
jgi:hypothetical protein